MHQHLNGTISGVGTGSGVKLSNIAKSPSSYRAFFTLLLDHKLPLMHKNIYLPILLLTIFSCSKKMTVDRTHYFPTKKIQPSIVVAKDKVWVFIMAGQSNMAGRGLVQPQDTIPNKRIYSIDQAGYLILAKEPFHFYEPNLTGLDCGMSFALEMLDKVPPDVHILMIPTAVGGSAISQWLNDETYRNVTLLSNFKEKVTLGKSFGTVKAVLWHQGESDSNPKDIPHYQDRLQTLFSVFRSIIGNPTLPIIAGELGSYSENKIGWQQINDAMHKCIEKDPFAASISTMDLKHKGDLIHFDSKGQREMGKRFAMAYQQKFLK